MEGAAVDPMGMLLAMIQRAGEQPARHRGTRLVRGRGSQNGEGCASSEERRLLRQAAGGAGLAELRAAVAVDVARCVHVVQQAFSVHAADGVALPIDIGEAVARAAVTGVADCARRQLCGCGLLGTGRHSLRWEGESSGATARTATDEATPCIVCARCGRYIRLEVRPRVRQPGGELCPLGAARISAGLEPAAWKQCRHFHLEGVAGAVVVRHRMSGLHSFRTAVAAEWVLAGTVVYELTFRTVAIPDGGLAIGIGMVTPSALVNSDVAWAPGTRDWAHAWGVCIEGEAVGEQAHGGGGAQNQIRAIETPWFCGGRGATVDAPRFCPTVSEGTRFRVAVDATSRSLRVCVISDDGKEQLCGELWLQGEEEETNPPSPGLSSDEDLEEQHSDDEEHAVGRAPLALALALKFAGDEVSVIRCG